MSREQDITGMRGLMRAARDATDIQCHCNKCAGVHIAYSALKVDEAERVIEIAKSVADAAKEDRCPIFGRRLTNGIPFELIENLRIALEPLRARVAGGEGKESK